MGIAIGSFELRPGCVRLGNVFALCAVHRLSQCHRLRFYRPDEEHTAYYLFWKGWELVWEFPALQARKSRVAASGL